MKPTVMIVTKLTELVQQGVCLKAGTIVLVREPEDLPGDLAYRYLEATLNGLKWFLFPRDRLTVDRVPKIQRGEQPPNGGDE